MKLSKHAKRYGTIALGITALTLSIAGPARAQSNTIVNFEDAESRGLSDNSALTNQYIQEGFQFGLDNNNDGIIDAGSSAFLERTGADTTSGFISSSNGKDAAADGFYDEANNVTYADRLGDYFLRTAGLGGNGGNFIISYTESTAAASGELWDLDGGKKRKEQWLVEALSRVTDESGNTQYQVVETVTSPLGVSSSSNPEESPYESRPWLWSFERETNDINAIRMSYVGEAENIGSVGLAFDNFSAYSAERTPGTVKDVPYELESSLGLLGLASIVGYRKFKAKRKATKQPIAFS